MGKHENWFQNETPKQPRRTINKPSVVTKTTTTTTTYKVKIPIWKVVVILILLTTIYLLS